MRRDLYFVNPAVDAFFLGGASILVFLFYRFTLSGYAAGQVSGSALWASATLAWIGNWPHFSATGHRLYGSRENLRQFPLTAWLVPAVVALLTAAAFYFPASFAPAFIKLFVLWSPYHFSAQTLGITLIYARRAGFPLSTLERNLLAGFFLASFLVQYTETETSLHTAFMYAMSYPQLALPAFTPLACQIVMYGCLAALAAICARGRKWPPWIVAFPLLTQYLWFVFGARDFSFQLLVPFFHALQYLLIACAVQAHSHGPSPLAVLFGSARWLAFNVIVGGLLFFGLPRLLAMRGWNLDFSILTVAAGLSLHHYFVDGVIWKLRQQKERSPLFLNIANAWRDA